MALMELSFDSKYLGASTRVTVIIPDRRENQTIAEYHDHNRKYKVVWLLHGGHGDHTDWIRKSMIELYACEQDVMIVCPGAQSSFYQNWPQFGPGYYFREYFFDELMPLIYHWLPASDRREDNYIAGLSMGGVGTLTFLADHPEKFAAAAVMSGTPFDLRKTAGGTPNMVAVYRNLAEYLGGWDKMLESSANVWDSFANTDKTNLPRLYFSCGKNDSGFENYLNYIQYLKEKGFTFVHDESTDYAHEWREWDYQIQNALKFFLRNENEVSG